MYVKVNYFFLRCQKHEHIVSQFNVGVKFRNEVDSDARLIFHSSAIILESLIVYFRAARIRFSIVRSSLLLLIWLFIDPFIGGKQQCSNGGRLLWNKAIEMNRASVLSPRADRGN